MTIVQNAGTGEVSLGFYGHEVDNSLRFNNDDSAYLNRAITTNGSAKKSTFSCWIKQCSLNASTISHVLYNQGDDAGTNHYNIVLYQDDIYINDYDYGSSGSPGSDILLQTDRKFRDTNAWMNIIVRVDTTESTAADRVRLYINGVKETSFSTATYPDENADLHVMNQTSQSTGVDTSAVLIGRYTNTHKNDCYMAEVTYCDGQSLAPSSFGESKDGVWIPKNTSGLTFGTNGFRLEFKQTGTGTASTSTIGADTSGQTNHFTSNNLAAHDVVPDSPTRNFATMNPLMVGGANTQVHASATYAEGNLKVGGGGFSTSTIGGGFSTIAIPKDKKIYMEFCETDIDGVYHSAGILIQDHVQASNQIAGNGSVFVYNRSVFVNGSENDYGSSAGLGGLGVLKLAAGDVLGIAVDGATGKVWFHRNGTYFKSPTTNDSGTTGNPSAGSNEIGTVTNTTAINPTGNLFFAICNHQNSDNAFINFGQDSTFAGNKSAGSETDANGEGLFQYAVPTDYVCLHSGNMSDPTIGPTATSNADDYFNTVIWTGNGSDGRSITGVGFDPDWVWIKSRNLATSHLLNDTIRGANKSLFSEGNNAETADNGGGYLSAFVTDGFSVTSGGSGDDAVNDSSDTYVAWNWLAGTAFSNDASATSVGDTDSEGQVSTKAGFAIIKWTSGGSSVVAHGLGKKPDFIIIKSMDGTENWLVGNSATGFANRTKLNTDDAEGSSSAFSGGVTTTTFTENIAASSYDKIGYLFANTEGYCAAGSYVGNGNADGTFIHTGFSPAWVLIKQSSTAGNWNIMDNTRQTFNDADGGPVLRADISNAEEETDTMQGQIDILSNGFKLRANNSSYNTNGATSVYLAFAEIPYKFSNAR